MVPPRLRLDHVTKAYAQKSAQVNVLNDITLDVQQGELVSLLGPSGCGKTTTLNIIGGFIVPDSGTVSIGGVDATRVPPYRRSTAMVFQNYALFPHMTVRENTAYGLRARHVPKPEIGPRVDAALELLSIGNLADRYPAQLSGGQQQRVAVARAVVVEPEVLLLDEPLSNLDVKLRREVRTELRNLQQNIEQTAVFVTHDQEEAIAISDRIAVLNGGVIEQIGTPEEIYDRPRTTFVADFLGVENIFPVSRDGAGWRVGDFLDLARVDGAPSHVGIRQRALRLAGSEQSADRSGAVVPATVRQRTYLGAVIQYELEVGPSRSRIVADVPRSGEEALDAGAGAFLTIPGDALLYLADRAADPAPPDDPDATR